MNYRINKLAVDILEWDGEWKSLSCDHADYRRRLDRLGDALASASRRSGLLRTEPISVVSAVPEPAAIAEFVALLDTGEGSLSHQLEYAMRDALAKARGEA